MDSRKNSEASPTHSDLIKILPQVSFIHREHGGTLGMVPFVINPIYTLYGGYLLGSYIPMIHPNPQNIFPTFLKATSVPLKSTSPSLVATVESKTCEHFLGFGILGVKSVDPGVKLCN